MWSLLNSVDMQFYIVALRQKPRKSYFSGKEKKIPLTSKLPVSTDVLKSSEGELLILINLI